MPRNVLLEPDHNLSVPRLGVTKSQREVVPTSQLLTNAAPTAEFRRTLARPCTPQKIFQLPSSYCHIELALIDILDQRPQVSKD